MHTLKSIPRGVWALGFVSLFMDTSSELIHSLLPIFMVTTLGASMTAVGLVEGLSESVALIIKIFSGTLSDYLGKRKLITLIGYGLSTLTKPFFPLAQSISMVLTARFIDRMGKGIRGAPRDALLADITPPQIRGACFGLRQALDTVGAFLGPLLAVAGMLLLSGHLRNVLWIAVIPAAISLFILAFVVKEPKIHHEIKEKKVFRFHEISRIGPAYWQIVALGGVLTLARFSDAFLILKAQAVGLPLSLIPLVMVVMNIVFALAAYPAGLLFDRIDRKGVLILGMIFLIAADIVLALTSSLSMLALGVSLWGLNLAFTQGALAALIAETAPAPLRGTAYGIFNFVSGIAMLAASILAGMLWDFYGPFFTFFTGAAFTFAALIGFLVIYKRT